MCTKIGDINVERLKGSENYHAWKETIKNILVIKDLSECLTGTEKDVVKINKAKAYLTLSVEPVLQCHITNLSTAKEMWDHLSNMFEDARLLRQVSLLTGACSLFLKDCINMQEYVSKMTDYFNR